MPDTNSNKNKFLVIIGGPTAVGKSAVSMSLAKAFNSVIFSADSRQLYKEMNIGTAKPSEYELNKIKHYFINHISIFDNYSVGHYEKEIEVALNDYFLNNDIAIVCGGTGLYLRAILEGLDEFPEIPISVTDNLDKIFKDGGLISLQEELQLKDPEYYNTVDLCNHRRIMRALAVNAASGVKYSSYLKNKKQKQLSFNVIQILLELPREDLYRRINLRVENMMEDGLLEEAKSLIAFREYQSLQTVGYQELFKFLDGEYTLPDAVNYIKQNSRHYAKRQITWFKKHGEWRIFNPGELESIRTFIENQISKR